MEQADGLIRGAQGSKGLEPPNEPAPRIAHLGGLDKTMGEPLTA